MTWDSNGKRYTSKSYESVRKFLSEELKVNNPASRPEVRRTLSEKAKGRTWHGVPLSEDSKKSISNTLSDYFNTKEGLDARRRLSNIAKEWHSKLDESTKLEINTRRSTSLKSYHNSAAGREVAKKLSKRMSGSNNHMFGIPPKIKGGKWVNNGKECKIALNYKELLESGWTLGRLKR